VLVVALGAAAIAASAWASIGDLSQSACYSQSDSPCTAPATVADALTSVSAVTVSPDGSNLYAASNNNDAIDTFSRSSSGALTFQSCIGEDSGCTASTLVQEPRQIAVSSDGTSVYVAADGSGLLDFFSRNPTNGALTYENCFGVVSGCTHTSPATALSGIDGVAVSADGKNVYAISSSANAVSTFTRTPSTGALSGFSCIGNLSGCTTTSPATAIDEPQGIVVSPDGNDVYVGSYLGDNVSEFTRTTMNGALNFAACTGDLSGCTATTGAPAALEGVEALAISPDSLDVYASTVDNDVATLSRTSPGGALTYQGCIGDTQTSGCTATSPAGALNNVISLAISGDGDSLYAGSDNTPVMAAFGRAANGALTFTDCLGALSGCTATSPSNALNGLESIALSPDGSSLYTAGNYSSVLALFTRLTEPPPSCQNATETIPYNTATATFTLPCSDPGGEPLNFALNEVTPHGVVHSISSTGVVSYSANGDYSGPDSFTYTASNSFGSSAATVTLTIPPPPAAVVSTASFDGQSLSLTTPSPGGCNVASDGLAFTISSTKVATSTKTRKGKHAPPQLKFVEAEFFIDGGMKETGTRKRHHKTVHYTYLAPNQIAHQNPRTDSLAITGLASGSHALKVVFVYKRGHKTVTKTLSTTFTVC
jgi:DNA-binding beta-propeller fold protein YncE